MKQKHATIVMGRRDVATVAAFGDRWHAWRKSGCAHVSGGPLPVNSERYSDSERQPRRVWRLIGMIFTSVELRSALLRFAKEGFAAGLREKLRCSGVSLVGTVEQSALARFLRLHPPRCRTHQIKSPDYSSVATPNEPAHATGNRSLPKRSPLTSHDAHGE